MKTVVNWTAVGYVFGFLIGGACGDIAVQRLMLPPTVRVEFVTPRAPVQPANLRGVYGACQYGPEEGIPVCLNGWCSCMPQTKGVQ